MTRMFISIRSDIYNGIYNFRNQNHAFNFKNQDISTLAN